jgi:hypothetical protein
MTINFEKMCSWEQEKAQFLCRMVILNQLPIDGIIDVNMNSGYTYYWHEDLSFQLFMPINCELRTEAIFVIYVSFEDGEEFEEPLNKFYSSDNLIQSIENWITKIENNKTN